MHAVHNHRAARRLLIIASALVLIHGIIEMLSILGLFMPQPIHFAFEELNQSWQATIVVGIVSGALRITAVVGIWKNRMWGWVLAILMSTITFSMLTLYLPAGATDAVLSGGALILLLAGKFYGMPIVRVESKIT
jgi:uncharacterized membrane protein